MTLIFRTVAQNIYQMLLASVLFNATSYHFSVLNFLTLHCNFLFSTFSTTCNDFYCATEPKEQLRRVEMTAERSDKYPNLYFLGRIFRLGRNVFVRSGRDGEDATVCSASIERCQR